MFNKLKVRVLSIFRRRKAEAELDEELRYHLEKEIERHIAGGMSPREARMAALRGFGGFEQKKEECRDARRLGLVEDLMQDLHYGGRMLWKKPGFTLVVVLTLGLGIGANTAVFTLIDALLLRTLPVPSPHEIVAINALNIKGRIGFFGSLSFPMYRDLRARQEVFTDLLASRTMNPVRLTIPSGTGSVDVDNVQTSLVSANYFKVLDVQPFLGRFFSEDDDRNPGSSETAGSVAVLSYSFWERQFGLDPGVLDRVVIVDRSPCRVIGVAPRGFFGEKVGSEPDLWAPIITFSPRSLQESRGFRSIYGIGRLKPGMSREQAEAAMTLLYRQLLQPELTQTPSRTANRGSSSIEDFVIRLEPGATGFSFGRLRQTFAKPLRIIMAIVALVLLIACANVAKLLFARAVARRREISVRLALGCGRTRLMRQLLTESLMLSALGTLAGIFIAWWSSSVLLRMVDTEPVPLRVDLSPDMRVMLFAAAVMVLTGIGFGLAPAWRATRFDLTSAMKDQMRGTGNPVKQYLGRTLVVIQVALSLLLLIGAGLLIRSLNNLNRIDLGFRPEKVLHFQLAHRPTNNQPEALALVAREVHERVRKIPGVDSASVSWWTLFSRGDFGLQANIQDYTPAPNESIQPRFNFVSPGYFETVGMSLSSGRGIEERDVFHAPMVAVINETMLRRYFPAGNAIGRVMEITENFSGVRTNEPIEIVGVVRDAKFNDLRAETRPMAYLPIQQAPSTLGTIEVRTSQPLATISSQVRNALLEVSRDLMIRRAVPLQAQVDQTLASERLLTTLATCFGVLALLLSSVGLYGVLSYMVEERQEEIGISRALGATDRNVVWMVLRQSMTVVVAGVAIGMALAFLSTRLLSGFLYGLSPTDPGAIALSSFMLLIVALFACFLPARRATRVDPLEA